MPPKPVGGRTVGVGIGVGVTFGVAVTTTVGVGVTTTVGEAAGAPQVRLRSFAPTPVALVLFSAAVALSHLKLIVPPGKQGGETGMPAGTVSTYLPPELLSVAHVIPSLSTAVMVEPSGAGWPPIITVPV
jgi:hypothetical protein